MIPNDLLPSSIIHAVHLRCPSSSGTKDWVGAIHNDPKYTNTLWVVNGKTKDVLSGGGQGRAVKAPGTVQSLWAMVAKKLGEGYALVDEYQAKSGWDSQSNSSTQPNPVPTPQPTPDKAPKPSKPIPPVVKPRTPDIVEKDEDATWCF